MPYDAIHDPEIIHKRMSSLTDEEENEHFETKVYGKPKFHKDFVVFDDGDNRFEIPYSFFTKLGWKCITIGQHRYDGCIARPMGKGTTEVGKDGLFGIIHKEDIQHIKARLKGEATFNSVPN